ncbi:hypothetical protein [Streptomyces flavidovirens]|uniref:hypothetical protein n=1 Tax=Streptomyces flavidovirens TaxID=67298 RepID=UPI0036AE4538
MSTKSVTLSALASAVTAFGLGVVTMSGENVARPVPASQPDTDPEAGVTTPDVAATPATEPVAKPKADTESSAGRDAPQAEAATPAATASSPAKRPKDKGKHRAAKPDKTAKPKAAKGLGDAHDATKYDKAKGKSATDRALAPVTDGDKDGKILDGVVHEILPDVDLPHGLMPFFAPMDLPAMETTWPDTVPDLATFTTTPDMTGAATDAIRPDTAVVVATHRTWAGE